MTKKTHWPGKKPQGLTWINMIKYHTDEYRYKEENKFVFTVVKIVGITILNGADLLKLLLP